MIVLLAAAVLAAAVLATAAPHSVTPDVQPALPLRAVFYYPWFPEAWRQHGVFPYTNYTPTLGSYDSSDQELIRKHLAAMQYGGIQAGIASWWGQGTRTDQRMGTLLAATSGSAFRWAIYYEQESLGDPSVSQLRADLTYLQQHYGVDPGYLRIDGRFVVFVYTNGADDCTMAERWKQANTVNAYIVLKVFTGYRDCASQPDSWHQYVPAKATDAQLPFSYTISPGFNKVGENPRLERDLGRWKQNIRTMVASKAPFQLVTTFNEWGEGTAVEAAHEWASDSGYGVYLDALHTNGAELAFIPLVLNTASPPGPTTTLTFAADADAQVAESSPTANYGASTTLGVDGGSGVAVESYLRFAVSGVSSSVRRATLRVYALENGTSNGPAVYSAGNTWAETEITWNTRPARISGAADNKGAIGTNVWVEYDVTPLVVGDGTYSFVLAADSTDAVVLSSREGGLAPQLVLTLDASTPNDPVLVGAGDIAGCNSSGDEATARLLDDIPGTVYTTGDNVYDSGTPTEFANCYNPSWGRHKARTRPSAGNHEYKIPHASGYYTYFGAAAGDPGTGYYSYDLGTWHIIVLNSNCAEVGGCKAGSPQEQWLRADLAAHPSVCTLAYWHHPRFSSGPHGNHTSVQAFWQALYEANADVVLNGHDHDYERFAPQDPAGSADPLRGIREFVVGSGGKDHYVISLPIANSEAHNDDTFGVLRLTLHPNGYDWTFVPETGKTFTDSGSARCH